MLNLLTAIFRMNWFGHLLFAALFGLAGYGLYGAIQRDEAEKAAALDGAVPPPVALADFRSERDRHPADEVNVLGWINDAYSYRLVQEKRGRADKERLMYVLFDGAQDETARTAHAAILVKPQREDAFLDWLEAGNPRNQILTDAVAHRFLKPVRRFNGAFETRPELKDLAEGAFAEAGLQRAENFFYIEPWIDGRHAALAPDPDLARQVAGLFGGLTGVFLLMGLVKLARRKRRAEAKPSRPRSDAPLRKLLDAGAKETERLNRRQTERPPFVQSRIPSLFALVFFLGYYLIMSFAQEVPSWMKTGEFSVPFFFLLLIPLYVAYRFGALDGIAGKGRAGPRLETDTTGERLPFKNTLTGKVMGLLFIPVLFVPLLLPIVLLAYGVAYLIHRFGAPDRPVRPRTERVAGQVPTDLDRYLGAPSSEKNGPVPKAAVLPRQRPGRPVPMKDPWGPAPTLEPRPLPSARTVEASGDAPMSTKPAARAKPGIATPFSDAVRRKAQEDPFERLRKRYPNLHGGKV